MNEKILQEAGLTQAEAHTYAILVKNSPCAPPKLADLTDESRTNTYKILDTLEEKRLVTRDDSQKKLRYWANNPSVLLDAIEKERVKVENTNRRLQSSLPELIDTFLTFSEQPSIRYFHGVEGIRDMYDDQLHDGKPVTFIHSMKVTEFFGMQKLHDIRNQFPKAHIPRHVFSPDIDLHLAPDEPKVTIEESNKQMLLERTWIDENDLVSPVEWSVYGNKLSITSLGTEVVGMIIESPQIAQSFRELLDLFDRNIRAQPDYDQFPKKLKYTKKPSI